MEGVIIVRAYHGAVVSEPIMEGVIVFRAIMEVAMIARAALSWRG